MLEIRRNRFAKPYENEFFRIFSKKLSIAFDKLNINGVLLGSPVCSLRNDLQLDALLITETGIVIIDFKNYAGIIELPFEKDFNHKPWFNYTKSGKKIEIKGGNRKNPFTQTFLQKEKFDQILIDFIVPKLFLDENIEIKDTYPVVCFQQEITIQGEIPSNLQRIFHITSPTNIVSKLTDLLYVAPNEWNGSVKGYKLNQNTFDNLKVIFKADAYNPFEDLSLFEEFEKIDFSDYVEEALFVEQQFELHKAIVDEFIESEVDILQINCDATPTKIPFASKIVSHYLEKNKLADEATGNVFYLAPTNKHVADLTRDGADFNIQSLYSKLYDFDNSTIELMDNDINEREIFPLQENKDSDKSLYIIFNAHLVYHFENNTEDLIRFGSGSLCNDTLSFINVKDKKNKVILLNDTYFYGFRAQTIADKQTIEDGNYSKLQFSIDCNPLIANQKTIANIEKNINTGIFNQLYWDNNPNIQTVKEEAFRKLLNERIINNQLHKTHILTREKSDAETTNNWVRKILKNSGKIEKGDVVWIKNKVMLPEITDPFSIPKFALSGDMGEVLEVINRFSFKSRKYNLRPIEISHCKIKLHDYDSIKDIYLYDYSNIELDKFETALNIKLEIKQHIQIRQRELVAEYLEKNSIDEKTILNTEEYKKYLGEIELATNKLIFKDTREDVEKETNKVKAKWKINKRKEAFAKIELLRDINSEYFILNQFAFYEFGWSLPVKNAYGYQFDDSFLIEYISPEHNAERVHQYLYSALICSHNLYLHNLSEFSPLIGLSLGNIVIPEEQQIHENKILFTFSEGFENKFTDELKQKLLFENKSISLLKFCEFISNKINANGKLKLVNVSHFNFQERYEFELDGNSLTINFSYNNRGEFKIMANQSVSDEVLNLFASESHDKEPYHFMNDGSWLSKLFIQIQEKLLEKGAFIYDFTHHDWLFDFKILLDTESTRMQFNYNGDGFVTRLNVVSTTSQEISQKIIDILKELAV